MKQIRKCLEAWRRSYDVSVDESNLSTSGRFRNYRILRLRYGATRRSRTGLQSDKTHGCHAEQCRRHYGATDPQRIESSAKRAEGVAQTQQYIDHGACQRC